MNKRDAKKFLKQLEEERDRLSGHIRNLEVGALQETALPDNSGDISSYAETGTDNFERETALNIATNESNRILDIEDAIKRVESGLYGVCEGCEEEIPKKRLDAFPSARYCIKCQSKIEKNGSL